MLNRVELIGNLGRDPEIRTMQNGDKVCNLSIATTERWKKDGQKQEKTEWHRVVIFGNLAGIAEQYLSKGSKVYLAGKLQTRKWQDQSGADKYSTEVVLSGFDGKLIMLDGASGGAAPKDDGPKYGDHRSGNTPPADLDDDVPFLVPFDIDRKRRFRT